MLSLPRHYPNSTPQLHTTMASSAAPAFAVAATGGDGCCPPGSLPALVLDSDRKGKLAGTVETLKSGLKVYSVPPPGMYQHSMHQPAVHGSCSPQAHVCNNAPQRKQQRVSLSCMTCMAFLVAASRCSSCCASVGAATCALCVCTLHLCVPNMAACVCRVCAIL